MFLFLLTCLRFCLVSVSVVFVSAKFLAVSNLASPCMVRVLSCGGLLVSQLLAVAAGGDPNSTTSQRPGGVRDDTIKANQIPQR